MNKRIISNILLLVTALIWGSSFVAQKAGTALEPFTYNGIRTLVGGISLVPVILILSRVGKSKADEAAPKDKKPLILGGIVCGTFLAIASNLQQFGMYFDADAGKAGFITALYIMIVPILGMFLGKRVRPLVWFCVLLGACGFYLLTIAGKGVGLTIEKGDLFVLLCAVLFSCHILAIDHFSPKCDGVKLSCLQFFVAGGLSFIMMLIFESPDINQILDCWFPIIYAGVFSCGIAYTLQVVAQKNAEPTAASLILSLESVFAVISGAILLGERMTGYEILGCIVIFIAVILAQLPEKDNTNI
ncbi:permease [Eubacterium sulci ATCC 35585]|nr:permease [Eubacterium sulci ATCC 35585]EUC77690.1 EamA-like transporter family protein [Eubacterium sulci ATCC 35585]